MKNRNLANEVVWNKGAKNAAPARLDPIRVIALASMKTASAQAESVVKPLKANRKRGAALAIAAALALALSVTALAGSGVIKSITAKNLVDIHFYTLPTEAEAMESAGFVPVFKTGFKNGYTFSFGWLTEYTASAAGGYVIDKVCSYQFSYEPEGLEMSDETEVVLLQTQLPEHEFRDYVTSGYEEIFTEINGVLLYYFEDPVLDKNGNPTGNVCRRLLWDQNGIHFDLGNCGALDREALLGMARELIEQNG